MPYEEGWTATVNGQPAEVLRVNLGFMAVVCDEGENEIAFSFETPGLKTGFAVAGVAAVAILLYLGYDRRIRPRRKNAENLRRIATFAEKTLD